MEIEVGTLDLAHALEAGLMKVEGRARGKGVERALEVAPEAGRVEVDEA